ncbi:hypothetical protein [Type-D symbiont of Plautia stali]|uniref:hypothetical protein n=1 Tax=Type-D symbiont of Plautia stali TaxID=1560356 RepID=UPI00073F3B3B|nr:hypothetical protein [Type-D symbiont of Plautia stali]
MADINERIGIVEQAINDLHLDLYASKVAITVLSSVIDKMGGDPGLLANSYEPEKSSAPLVKFNHPGQEDNADEIRKRVLALLSNPE